MMPVRCPACGRRGLPVAPYEWVCQMPVAHVREDLPGQPCKYTRYPSSVQGDWQERNLDNMDI